MKRSPMPRPDADKLKAWRRRSKRVRPRNGERAAESYDRNYGERAGAVREMPCVARARPGVVRMASADCRGAIVAAHARARGMGGAKGNRFDLFPACAKHHDEAGERGTSQRSRFEERYGLQLELEAARIARILTEAGLP